MEALRSSEVSVNSKNTLSYRWSFQNNLFPRVWFPQQGGIPLLQIARSWKSRHFYLMMSPHPLSISYHCQYLFQFPKTPLSYLSYLLPFLPESISPLSFSVVPSNGRFVWIHFFPYKGTEFCWCSLMKRFLNPPRSVKPNDLETCKAVVANWL